MYWGSKSTTLNGKQCINWKDTVYNYLPGNLCSNPAKSAPLGAWCYTQLSPISEWSYCFPGCETCYFSGDCFPTKEKTCRYTNEFRGTKTTSVSGRPCVSIHDTQDLYKHYDTGAGGKNCRNPDGSDMGAWCYVKKGSQLVKESCFRKAETCAKCYNSWEMSCRGTDEYEGPKDTTQDGVKCIPWKYTPYPHLTHNLCRNANASPLGAFCFTSVKPKTWDYCFKTCPENCYEGYCLAKDSKCVGSNSYRGTLSMTSSGQKCVEPTLGLKDYSYAGQDKYCRNPDGSKEGAWCMVKDGSITKKEFCFLKPEKCDAEECFDYENDCYFSWKKQCHNTKVYRGNKKTTAEGEPCVSANGHSAVCSNSDGGGVLGPWCYTSADRSWGYCFQSCQHDCYGPNCFNSGNPKCKYSNAYRGQKSTTISGKKCLPLRNQNDGNYRYLDDADTAVCRNPDGREFGAWCYTGTDVSEYCFPKDDTCEGCHDAAGTCFKTWIRECHITDMYGGVKSTTQNGVPCIPWVDTDESRLPTFTHHPSNLCRVYPNAEGLLKPLGPWCYTSASPKKWDYCLRSCRRDNCYRDSSWISCVNSENEKCHYINQYQGYRNTSLTGRACLDLNKIHKGSEYLMPGNVCRNPDAQKYGAWCYVNNEGTTMKEYCFPKSKYC